jgi:hypothetical protein
MVEGREVTTGTGADTAQAARAVINIRIKISMNLFIEASVKIFDGLC